MINGKTPWKKRIIWEEAKTLITPNMNVVTGKDFLTPGEIEQIKTQYPDLLGTSHKLSDFKMMFGAKCNQDVKDIHDQIDEKERTRWFWSPFVYPITKLIYAKDRKERLEANIINTNIACNWPSGIF